MAYNTIKRADTDLPPTLTKLSQPLPNQKLAPPEKIKGGWEEVPGVCVPHSTLPCAHSHAHTTSF